MKYFFIYELILILIWGNTTSKEKIHKTGFKIIISVNYPEYMNSFGLKDHKTTHTDTRN